MRDQANENEQYHNVLLDLIQRYWKLDLDALAHTPFDIEECLTMFESQHLDGPEEVRKRAKSAEFALRHLLLMYLSEMHLGSMNRPAESQFGHDVMAAGADVLTFNYDTLAEYAIEHSSGNGTKLEPKTRPECEDGREVVDEDLDARMYEWNPNLAYGFEFDEVRLPVPGAWNPISGSRYYEHQSNELYACRRVLKLHGSINWLKYTSSRHLPAVPGYEGSTPTGVVLEGLHSSSLDPLPTRNGWYMEPVVIPPQLYKQFDSNPFRQVWTEALSSLSQCRELIVIGYSFPPTDFRTRRLFLEAFSDHSLDQLTVVNPDTSVTALVRRLTHFNGPVTSCDSLSSLYGLPPSYLAGPSPTGVSPS
jgi:hypothetical protein